MSEKRKFSARFSSVKDQGKGARKRGRGFEKLGKISHRALRVASQSRSIKPEHNFRPAAFLARSQDTSRVPTKLLSYPHVLPGMSSRTTGREYRPDALTRRYLQPTASSFPFPAPAYPSIPPWLSAYHTPTSFDSIELVKHLIIRHASTVTAYNNLFFSISYVSLRRIPRPFILSKPCNCLSSRCLILKIGFFSCASRNLAFDATDIIS